MRTRALTVAAVLGAAALGWLLWPDEWLDGARPVATEPAVAGPAVADSPRHAAPAAVPARTEPESLAAPAESEPVVQTPVDVDTRARFNEQARAFFANAAQMPAEDRLREARQIEQELARVEQAGGLSAGETLLIRAGLIRETVPAGAQQDAQLQALQQRYQAETQRRVAAAQARPDPQFGSYKVRENEIVSEVMAMETIPDGLDRNEYLRRRLQSAREQLTPQ